MELNGSRTRQRKGLRVLEGVPWNVADFLNVIPLSGSRADLTSI
jgi:hypothetical protein